MQKIVKQITFITLIFFLTLLHNIGKAQDTVPEFNPLANQFYYDADTIDVDPKSSQIELNGHATLFIGNLYLRANKIIFDRNKMLISTLGNVRIFFETNKITATHGYFDLKNHQMRVDNAVLISDPNITKDKLLNRELKISVSEILFENLKKERKEEISQTLKHLRQKYADLQNIKLFKKNNAKIDQKIERVKNQYSQNLIKYLRVSYQPNIYLSQLSPIERQKIEERRSAVKKFIRNNPQLIYKMQSFAPKKGYIFVKAKRISRINSKTLLLDETTITPCRCAWKYHLPAYGFSAQHATLHPNDYIFMKDISVDVMSLPVLYSPFLAVPISHTRRSGFLLPSGYISTNSGKIFQIPYYLTLGDHADTTLHYQFLEDRGHSFKNEFRLQLFNDSYVNTRASLLKDSTYFKDVKGNNEKIDQAIRNTTDPTEIAQYRSYKTEPLNWRGDFLGTSNIDIWNDQVALKSHINYVSDNFYYSDISPQTLNPLSTVLGVGNLGAKRFLRQEIATEYYGETFNASLRLQGISDSFAPNQLKTPMRLPHIEVSLLPRRILKYVLLNQDVTYDYMFMEKTTSTNTNTLSPIKNTTDPMHELTGSRANSQTQFLVPLFSNDYIQTNISNTTTATVYSFQNDRTSYQIDNKSQFHVESDFYVESEDNNYRKLSGLSFMLQPFVNVNYVPGVARSDDFPFTYELWYAADNRTKSLYVEYGISEKTLYKRRKVTTHYAHIDKYPGSADIPVAHKENLEDILHRRKLKRNNIFTFSMEKIFKNVVNEWAAKELNDYTRSIHNHNASETETIWPPSHYGLISDEDVFQPLTVSASQIIDVLSDERVKELNQRAGPDFSSPYIPGVLGDVSLSATLNLHPYAGFVTNGNLLYSPIYHHISSWFVSSALDLPLHLKLSYSFQNQLLLAETGQDSFKSKYQSLFGVEYQPISWMGLHFQYAKSVDETAATDANSSHGRDYATSLQVIFPKIQDCFDLVLMRTKAAGKTEGEAAYLIGVNLKFFGVGTGFNFPVREGG